MNSTIKRRRFLANLSAVAGAATGLAVALPAAVGVVGRRVRTVPADVMARIGRRTVDLDPNAVASNDELAG